jgi:hypothetical protein
VGDWPLVIAERRFEDVGQGVGRVGREEQDILALGQNQGSGRGAGGLAYSSLAAEEQEAEAGRGKDIQPILFTLGGNVGAGRAPAREGASPAPI